LAHAFFFGEDQGRYVLTCTPGKTAAIADEAKRLDVPLTRIGATGGETLRLGGAAPLGLAVLAQAYESWLPDYMSRALGTNA
jgi:phosphoribosylformylglycinamidine synthase